MSGQTAGHFFQTVSGVIGLASASSSASFASNVPVSGSSVYHSPDEKPPGGMRFLLMTWPLPFSDGMVVLISAAPPDL